MKKLTAAALAALMLLSAAGCAKDDADTDITTETTVTTVETTATETTETTVTTVETEVTTVTTEAPVDLDALLEGYTVYDVTVEDDTDIANKSSNNGIHRFALRYTDIPGCAVIVDNYSNDSGIVSIFAYGHIIDLSDSLNFSSGNWWTGFDSAYYVEESNGIIKVRYGQHYCLINSDNVYFSGNTDEYRININLSDDGILRYEKKYEKYITIHALPQLIYVYKTKDDTVKESGYLELMEDGSIEFVTETVTTAAEWYKSDSFPFRNYRDEASCGTVDEFMALLREYVDSQEYKENKDFSEWIKEKEN